MHARCHAPKMMPTCTCHLFGFLFSPVHVQAPRRSMQTTSQGVMCRPGLHLNSPFSSRPMTLMKRGAGALTLHCAPAESCPATTMPRRPNGKRLLSSTFKQCCALTAPSAHACSISICISIPSEYACSALCWLLSGVLAGGLGIRGCRHQRESIVHVPFLHSHIYLSMEFWQAVDSHCA